MPLFERTRTCPDVEVGIVNRKSRAAGYDNITDRLDSSGQPDALDVLVEPVNCNAHSPEGRRLGERAGDASNAEVIGIDPDGSVDQILARTLRGETETIYLPA